MTNTIRILRLLSYSYKQNRNQIICKVFSKKTPVFLSFLVKAGYIMSFKNKNGYFIINLKYNIKGTPALTSLEFASDQKKITKHSKILKQIPGGIFITANGYMDLKAFKSQNSAGKLLCILF